jgi:RNA polymerase primary sigma factor
MEAKANKSWDENKLFYQYIKDIKKYPLLTKEEERVVLAKVGLGSQRAVDKLVTSNLKFVINIAQMYKGQGLSLTELINEGNLGLIEAARRFDTTRELKFISYAVWWIRQAITRAISEKARLVRISAEKELVLRKLNKQSTGLRQVIGGEFVMDSDELSRHSKYSSNQVEKIFKMGLRHSSLDTPVGEDGATSLIDMTVSEDEQPDHMAMQESDHKYIKEMMKELTEQERKVLGLYFGFENSYTLNLQEIGKIIGLSKERVRQVKEKALAKLREMGVGRELAAA